MATEVKVRLLRDVIDELIDTMQAIEYWDQKMGGWCFHFQEIMDEQRRELIDEYVAMLIEQTGPVTA